MDEKFSISEKIIWRWNRLQCMSVGEIKYRSQDKFKKSALKLGFFSAEKVAPPNFSKSVNSWIKQSTFYLDEHDYCESADRILNQGVNIFAVQKEFDEIIKDWNRDPKTGVSAPLSFGPAIKYMDASLVGDIKYLWEVNRCLWLVPLAQAYHLSRKPCYLESIEKSLTSWLDQCPYLQGPNWISPLELAIRLINWSIVWQLVGAQKSQLFKAEKGKALLAGWMESIYQHIHFILNNLSSYSSANNHLIGEAAGLFIAATTWPFWSTIDDTRKKSFNILEKEALLQNAPDGTNREQAISYQQFVLDFFIMAGLAGQSNGYRFSDDYWQRVETMIGFIGSVTDVSGNIPMIGDSDDGLVSALSPEKEFCNYRSLLATGAVLFDRHDFKRKAQRLDHKTCWLMGKKAVEMFAALNPQSDALPVQREFRDGGYYILGKNFEKNNEVKCLIHCGPLGFLSIAAHGHAAALAIYLSVGGREILIDPGTYNYHGEQKWRNYFRGTSSHCTVVVDDCDQSKSGGKFMWRQHAGAYCKTWRIDDREDVFSGYHDGYLRLKDPVTHNRKVVFDKVFDRITVTDSIECKKTHDVKRFWHFSENCNVWVKENRLLIENGGINVEMSIEDPDTEIQLFKASQNPLLGWISRKFDRKTPCFSAAVLNTVTGKTQLSTVIDIKAISLS